MAPSGGSGDAFEVLMDVDGSVVVRLMGDLDRANVPELEAAVSGMLSRRGGRLVIEAGDLEFADSSAIALWVRWANQAGHVVIRNPSPRLRRVISRMGLAERLRLTP
jgi:anti-anti-sigma factor